jgi:Leucine-rich repeat (LRR) protein
MEKVFALQKLNVSHNEINDFAEIDYLSALPNLEKVTLLGNSIAAHPNYRSLALQHFLQVCIRYNNVSVFDSKSVTVLAYRTAL